MLEALMDRNGRGNFVPQKPTSARLSETINKVIFTIKLFSSE